jgi:hypothetical protein
VKTILLVLTPGRGSGNAVKQSASPPPSSRQGIKRQGDPATATASASSVKIARTADGTDAASSLSRTDQPVPVASGTINESETVARKLAALYKQYYDAKAALNERITALEESE